jgi:hypothetical protein
MVIGGPRRSQQTLRVSKKKREEGNRDAPAAYGWAEPRAAAAARALSVRDIDLREQEGRPPADDNPREKV